MDDVGPRAKNAVAHSSPLSGHQVTHAVPGPIRSVEHLKKGSLRKNGATHGGVERHDRDMPVVVDEITHQLPDRRTALAYRQAFGATVKKPRKRLGERGPGHGDPELVSASRSGCRLGNGTCGSHEPFSPKLGNLRKPGAGRNATRLAPARQSRLEGVVCADMRYCRCIYDLGRVVSGNTVCAAAGITIGGERLLGAAVLDKDTDFHPINSRDRCCWNNSRGYAGDAWLRQTRG